MSTTSDTKKKIETSIANARKATAERVEAIDRKIRGDIEKLRGEIDFNRRLVKDKLAVRLSTVKSHNESWQDNVRRDFWGVYAAATYRPFRKTIIR